MAVLFDAFMTIDHSFKQNNLLILTAVLNSWMIVQSFGDFFGAAVDVGPFYLAGVMIFFFSALVPAFKYFSLFLKLIAERFQISELVLQLTVPTLFIVIRSILYYSAGHNVSAIVFYSITMSGLSTFTTILLIGLKYIRSGLNAADQKQTSPVNLAIKHKSNMMLLWKIILTINFIIGIYCHVTYYGKESVFTEPIGIGMLILIIISLGSVLCATTRVAVFVIYAICVQSLFFISIYTIQYHSSQDFSYFFITIAYFIMFSFHCTSSTPL